MEGSGLGIPVVGTEVLNIETGTVMHRHRVPRPKPCPPQRLGCFGCCCWEVRTQSPTRPRRSKHATAPASPRPNGGYGRTP
eukprot:7285233-Prymnesium_polylepis.2